MSEMNNRFKQKPVIFLAFANDRVDKEGYLRSLPIEMRGIREELGEGKGKDLCEVVERSNAAIEDILDVFQDNTYRNRIAIFHYGGHANSYQLLLESLAGGQAAAHRESLAAFLARQVGLKFIFLNGCSTQQHALELIKAGIPAVVGTSQSINDEVATNLSIRFYKGIAGGISLEQAWLAAEDRINMEIGTANFRAMYWPGKKEIENRFPWDIFYKKGAEKVKDWNLPEAAGDPLAFLPGIPSGKLPEKPYLFLNRYERKHAEIFFGRSYYIRDLYHRVTDEKSAPIILLYGQSGVGKSSLLDAGLVPRLEKSHTICYARRDPQKGLLGTLEQVLHDRLPVKKGGDAAQTWKYLESTESKPLVFILDQVEEVFTRPNKESMHEWEDFLEALTALFGNTADYPRGKLILGYRKEFHPEIDEKFKNYQFDRAPLYMKPLGREDIMDVVSGLTRTERLQDKYNIEVEEQLPVIIADDLLEDKNTPVAPVLQIILTKMWDTTRKDDHSPVRQFKVKHYQELRKNMLLLEDFFRQQLEKLGNWNMNVVNKGLALDVLKYHTTGGGSACARNIRDIQQTYRHRQDIIEDLVQQLKDFYLLTDGQRENETSLAHDTLAPVVIDEYNDSNRPAQRASRILAAKIEDFKKNRNEIYLDEVDLEIVKDGKKWMRAWDQDEEQLVEKSLDLKKEREKEKKRHKNIRIVLVILIFIFAVFAVIQWRLAVNRSRRSEANKLVAIAEREAEKDPTTALRLAEKAYQKDKNDIVTETLQKIYRENSFYKIIARQKDSISFAAVSPDGKYVLIGTAFEDKNAYLWDLQLDKVSTLKGHEYSIISAAFSHDGMYILTGSKDRTARLWDLWGNQKKVFRGHKDWVYSVAFSPDNQYILTGSRDRTACLWDLEGNPLLVFRGHEMDVLCAVFSPDGKSILTGSVDKTARLWNLWGNEKKVLRGHKDWVYSVAFSPDRDSKLILTGSRDKTARLWDLEGNLKQEFKGHQDVVNSAAFSPDGSYILTGSWDKTARLWDLRGNQLQNFIGHKNKVTSAVFSPDPKNQYILTSSWDKTIRKWSLKGSTYQVLKEHPDSVYFAAFSPDGQYILTGLKDGTIRLWDLKRNKKQDFKEYKHGITSAAFSPQGQHILIGFKDNTAGLWSFQGRNISNFKGHKDRITSVAFSPDNSYILTASWDNTARLWDWQGRVLRRFEAHKDDVNCAVFSPDGNSILTASWDNTAILWNLLGQKIQTFTSPGSLISCAAFSPNGENILTGSNDGIDTRVRLWDIKGNVLQVFKGHRYRISSVAFSPDGQYILTGSWDKTARLWDLQGNELQTFKGHEKRVNSAAFSPDGEHVLTSSADKTLRWEIRMPLKDFLEKGICEELTKEQKRRYEVQ